MIEYYKIVRDRQNYMKNNIVGYQVELAVDPSCKVVYN